MATAIVNGELNLVHASRYPVKPFAHYTYLQIRHADGSWSKLGTPFSFSSGPHAVAAVNGDLHVVQRTWGSPVRHAVRHADGSWSDLAVVPVPEGSTSISAVAVYGALEVLVIKDQSLVSMTLRADGTWSPATPTTFLPTQFTASSVDVARVGADLHAVINSTDGGLYHAIRFENGTWQRYGDVRREAGGSPSHDVAIAGD